FFERWKPRIIFEAVYSRRGTWNISRIRDLESALRHSESLKQEVCQIRSLLTVRSSGADYISIIMGSVIMAECFSHDLSQAQRSVRGVPAGGTRLSSASGSEGLGIGRAGH